MSQMKIVAYPSDILRKIADPVEKLTPDLLTLVRDMIETMFEEDGVGLAAPQVGISKRIIVASPLATPGTESVFINPEIFEQVGEEIGLEGCLSLPGIAAEVKRAKKIKFRAIDLKGDKVVIAAEDFFARIIQHEVDHLNGKLFIDRVAMTERKELLVSLKKNLMIG